MKKIYKKMDNLSEDVKAMICDNCSNDDCANAYTGFFNKCICYETWLQLREELQGEPLETE